MGSILSNCDLHMPQTSYTGAHKLRAIKKYYQYEKEQVIQASKNIAYNNDIKRAEFKVRECVDENKPELEEKKLCNLSLSDGILELEQENGSESEQEWYFSSNEDEKDMQDPDEAHIVKARKHSPIVESDIKVCKIGFRRACSYESNKLKIKTDLN